MSLFTRDRHITIPGFAVTDLKLSGNELICFSLIHGFSQDKESEFHGSLNYIASALNITKANAKAVIGRLLAKEFIVKRDQFFNSIKFCYYSVNWEKIENNNSGIETIPGGAKTITKNIDNSNIDNIDNINTIDKSNKDSKDKKIKKDINISLFNSECEGIIEESVRGEREGENSKMEPARHTIENLCLFVDSKFAKFEDFAAEFKGEEYKQIDLYYYHQVIMDWSASNGAKKRDWIATARNWMRSDKEKNKLHLIDTGMNEAFVAHFQQMAELFG